MVPSTQPLTTVLFDSTSQWKDNLVVSSFSGPPRRAEQHSHTRNSKTRDEKLTISIFAHAYKHYLVL
ncbi:hypothetical protein C0J52_16071 [Blattella germanica]|nr:hypothetical protein C0J52_16071 [Blattella germanica]